MSPCQCHKQDHFHDDWAALLTAEEKALVESGLVAVSSGPLVGADPEFVRNIMTFARKLDDPELQERRARAEAARREACAKCLCHNCHARMASDCEKNCGLCEGTWVLSRCSFRERYRVASKR